MLLRLAPSASGTNFQRDEGSDSHTRLMDVNCGIEVVKGAGKLGAPLLEDGVAEAALAALLLTGMPASTCLRKLMICSSLNLL